MVGGDRGVHLVCTLSRGGLIGIARKPRAWHGFPVELERFSATKVPSGGCPLGIGARSCVLIDGDLDQRPLHAFWELDVLELDQCHLDAHSSVWTSRILRMSSLIVSVSASASSSVCWPTTARSVVWAIWLIAARTSSIAITERTA